MKDSPEKNNLHEMPLKDGVNDCNWMCKGKCTNPAVTRNKFTPVYSRGWDSDQNCPLTIIGAIHCSGFRFALKRNESTIYKFIRVKRKDPKELRQVIKRIIPDRFTGSEAFVDEIEEDILEALGMERKGGSE